MADIFTVYIETKEYIIKVSPSTGVGTFTHRYLGSDRAGNLYFSGLNLTDFDGLFYLPPEVANGLRRRDFVVPDAYDS